MLLPDNIQPELSIYYISSLILTSINKSKTKRFIDIYEEIKSNYKSYKISLALFILSLDWLFLIDAVVVNDKGEVILCS